MMNPTDLPPASRAGFAEALRLTNNLEFDPAVGLLLLRQPDPNHHANIITIVVDHGLPGPVHPTRDTLFFAVRLLESPDPALTAAGAEILRGVLDLQDTDPASRTFGVWPVLSEVPLATEKKPDLNWADFFGSHLLDFRLPGSVHHPLPDALARHVDEAVARAAEAVRRRDVEPGYTNVAALGLSVMLLAAENGVAPADLGEFARERLRDFHDFSFHHGDFAEYNSPTYAPVTLLAFERILRGCQHPEVQRLTRAVHDLLFEGMALHFHAPTGQPAGPYSRTYRDLQPPGWVRTALRPDGDGQQLPGCPAAFRPYFETLTEPREVVRCYYRPDAANPRPILVNGEVCGVIPLVGTTYLTPEFAVGSIAVGDFWYQKRAVHAHFGTADAPGYLRVRFLHDGHDFKAPVIASAQKGPNVLSVITFATDGGDHDYNPLPDGGRFTARDLALRFEFGGPAAAGVTPTAPATLEEPAVVGFDNVRFHLWAAHARFGNVPLTWRAGREGDIAFLDLVLHAGPEEREFCFREMDEAILAFALSLRSATDASFPPTTVAEVDHGRLHVRRDSLSLSAPLRPATIAELHGAIRSPVWAAGVLGR